MRLSADSGLWSTGHRVPQTPLAAVMEVSGAVLSWTVDDPAAAQITFTDPARADWLWRVVGEPGHVAVLEAITGRGSAAAVEFNGVDVLPGSLEPLRRLAFGHWLRRWWPASLRDGIATLDGALLDAEIALLTAAADDFFTDDTIDSDVAALLRPHSAALGAHRSDSDPRVAELVRKCAELAEDIGVAVGDVDAADLRRDDYALAAGGDGVAGGPGAIASGTDSVEWGAVPPGIFDAAENSVDWRVEAVHGVARAVVQVALTGGGLAEGIPVRLSSGGIGGAGQLGADGVATFPIADNRHEPITESTAWDHDWRTTAARIGADRAGTAARTGRRCVSGRGAGRRVGLLTLVPSH